MNIAEQVAMKENAPVLFVSLEMNAVELVDRLLWSVAKVNGSRLRVGTISKMIKSDSSRARHESPLATLH